MSLRPCANPDCNNLVGDQFASKYCSNKCRQHAYELRNKNRRRQTTYLETRNCCNCGKRFTTHQPYAKFCKPSCRVSYWQQMKRIEKEVSL